MQSKLKFLILLLLQIKCNISQNTDSYSECKFSEENLEDLIKYLDGSIAEFDIPDNCPPYKTFLNFESINIAIEDYFGKRNEILRKITTLTDHEFNNNLEIIVTANNIVNNYLNSEMTKDFDEYSAIQTKRIQKLIDQATEIFNELINTSNIDSAIDHIMDEHVLNSEYSKVLLNGPETMHYMMSVCSNDSRLYDTCINFLYHFEIQHQPLTHILDYLIEGLARSVTGKTYELLKLSKQFHSKDVLFDLIPSNILLIASGKFLRISTSNGYLYKVYETGKYIGFGETKNVDRACKFEFEFNTSVSNWGFQIYVNNVKIFPTSLYLINRGDEIEHPLVSINKNNDFVEATEWNITYIDDNMIKIPHLFAYNASLSIEKDTDKSRWQTNPVN